MGKKRKIRTGAGDVIPAPGPLLKQIEKDKLAKSKFQLSKTQKKKDGQEKYIDAGLSTKILHEARKQWQAERNESGAEEDTDNGEKSDDAEDFNKQAQELADQIAFNSDDEADIGGFSTDAKCHEIGRTKKKEKQLMKGEGATVTPIEIYGINPAVVALFTEVGNVMAKYRSGKVPKAFKMVPAMSNWEQILEITCPEKWSSAAMFQATRAFAATGTPLQCQKFNSLVLLPRLRDEIDEYKKLNFHMYQCLFKAMFKPAAFFKGILLPLCKSGTCTLREAVIFGSVLRKISIPQLHAAAAVLSIAEMEYSGATSYILRVLVEKNYMLPYRALDGLVFYFLKIRTQSDQQQNDLPVIWHQSLLAFVERYAKDISAEHREALIELTKVQMHHQITPEVQRILRSSKSMNEESEVNARDNQMEL